VTQRTHDSWFNPVTGVGGPRDKTSGFTYGAGSWRQWDFSFLLDDLYREDDLAAVKVDAVVDDSFANGWSFESSLTPQEVEAVNDFNDRLGIQDEIVDADKWSRLFGGAAVYIGSDDGVPQDMPIVAGGKIAFAKAYERDELRASQWYDNPLSPKFGRPSHYRLTPYSMGGTSGAGSLKDIHESRFLLFYGAKATKRQRQEALGWGQSVLLRPMTALKQFNGAYALILSLLADANQNIYKIKDFGDLLRAGNAGEITQKRIEIIDKFRSAVNALVIDAEDEDFVRSQLSLSGIEGVATQFKERIAAAFEMPLTRIFGVSPAGLNATGESDQRNWNKQVRVHQSKVLTPALERWLKIVFLASNGPTRGKLPDTWQVKFPSLWDMSPKEEAEVDSINAQIDQVYFDMGMLKRKHIASRFSGDRLRPSLGEDDIQALEHEEALVATVASPSDAAEISNSTEDDEDIATGDEPDVDHDLLTFVDEMNTHGIERCPHDKLNRCRICGIESIRSVTRGADGSPVFASRWRTIGSFGTSPHLGQPQAVEAAFGQATG
jgi:uncharacterized protein